MFKNVKKLFLLLVLTLVGVLAFACGEECPECNEANKESCKEFCETCPEIDKEACKDFIESCPEIDEETCKDFIPEIDEETCKDFINVCEKCEECNEANEENCKGFCEVCQEINEETCQEFFPYVAPTGFILLEDFVKVGETVTIIAEEFEPIADNVYTGLFWSSSDETIATVDGEGVVTGIKPGTVTITATSVLDPEVSESCEVTVNDSLEAYDLLQREKALISANVPAYTAESFEFPKPWNESVEMIITDEANNEVTGFTYPEGLAKETKYTYTVTLTYGSNAPETFTVSFWAVLDAQDNSYVRLAKGLEAIEILIKDATNGKLVDADMLLPTYVYGATFTWDSALPSIIDDEGVYTQQNDDTPVSFDLVGKCGDNSTSKSYTFTAKGYSKEEKLAYILEEGSLANVAGKTVSTSIVLPAYDGKFNAALSYVSSKPEIMDNTGKLVAAPEVATEVEFTVTVNYEFVKTHKFTADTKFTVTVAPANAASKAADAWLQESGFAQLVNFPYGTEKGNVLDVPTEYTKDEVNYTVKWNVSKALVAPKYLAEDEEAEVKEIPAFELTEEGKPELVVQYLRYQEVQIQGTFSDGTNEAVVTLVLNIGASEGPQYVYSGTWTTGDQKDTSLNPVTGEYDTMANASHFDKNVGYVSRTLGYGYWSGVKITAPEYEGAVYESFILDYMYWEVVDDGNGGVAKRDLALFNNGGDMGGNWGWFMHNTTDKDVLIEVGTYAATGQTFSDGLDVVSGGSRVSYAMDGYAVGFVADKDGKILAGSGNGKLQNAVPSTNLVKIGSDEAKYFVGDSKSGTVYYLTVPAGGYAMSWKYQFYSQKVQSLYPLCQTGADLEITKYGVHPLNSTKATSALTNLENAEAAIAEGGIAKNSSIESYLIAARNSYNNDLGPVTKAEVFSAERIDAAEKAAGALVDAEITALLANEKDAEGNVVADFPTKLGSLYNRFAKYTPELLAYVTKKADFDAKYAEYAAIDLYINYDYNGGYAQGYIYDTQKDVLMPMFLKDLYDHMVAKGAFQKEIGTDADGATALVDYPALETPSFETFCTNEYWNNFAQYKATVLNYYLFTAYTEDNENYNKYIEGSDRFFNTEKGQYWLPLADWVNEATQYANGAGQDFWGRNGLNYVDCSMLKNQTYYNSSMYKDITGVLSTNSGTLLGCYRFAQYVMNSSINGNYKEYVPNKVWSTIFDRQTTQEQYGQQVYHCTDATVKLLDAPYKAGAEFAGWFFEDGTEAVVTGSMFKDVTVYAKWNIVIEEPVEGVLGEDVTPVYYPAANPVKANTEPGTLADQAASYGFGKYAVIVDGKMFVMPKFAVIELAAGDYSTKDSLQVYGKDGYDQNSTGLIYDSATDTVKAGNSYGHGALYQNVSDGEIVIPNVALAYGRELGGTAYGYHKYQFVLQEDGSYVAKLIGANGEAKLAKGDFLWAPMTDARFCTGLSDCDGTSGVKGVLADGKAVKVVDISGFVPADTPWNTVKFVNGDAVVSAQYLEVGQTIVKPADLTKDGYTFLGWAKAADATEAEEVVETTTEDITYYAVFKKLDSYEATSVNPATDGTKDTEFATIADALAKTLPGGTITVAAGTYNETLTIEKSVKILGPNANVKAYGARAEEAVFTGVITLAEGVEGFELNGFKLAGATQVAVNNNVKGVNVSYNVLDAVNLDGVVRVVGNDASEIVLSHNYSNNYAGNRVFYVSYSAHDIELSYNVFENNTSNVFDFVNAGVIYGDFKVVGNKFENGAQSFLYVRGVGVLNATITENYVSGIANTFVDFRDMKQDGHVQVEISNNTFKDSVIGWMPIRIRTAGYDANDTIEVQIFDNKFIEAFAPDTDGINYYMNNPADSSRAIYVVGKNLFIENGVANLEVNNTQFLNSAISFETPYASEAELDSKNYEATAKEYKANKFAAGYVDGTHVYIAYKYQFNAYYEAEVALKYVPAFGYYEVIANEQNCTLAAGSYDLLLAVHSACANADAAAVVKSLKKGDKIVLSASYAELTGYTATSNIDVTVTVYPAVEKVTIQDFADEIVALFNSPTEADKVETKQNNFTGSTHPNVKYVFDDAETLAEYKWFIDYVIAQMKEKCEADGTTGDAWYVETMEMLTKMSEGDTAAISGSYANGRTCLRQFIHRLINAENTAAEAGNTAYNPYIYDFAAAPEKVAAFLELYKANK